MLRGVDLLLVTDVSGQSIVSTFKGQAARIFLGCCFFEDENDWLSRNLFNWLQICAT
jgi:hypothetical protein